MTKSTAAHLPTFTCPLCRAHITSDPYEPNVKGAAPTAKKFEHCLRRCVACGVGYSNDSNPDHKEVPIIFANPLDNLPQEVREKAIETLLSAVNEVNRPSKLVSFCSENSEDAVTWTVFSYLAKSGKIRATFNRLGFDIGAQSLPEPLVFLWGVPLFADASDAEAGQSRLLQIIDSIEHCPRSRTEPDVVLDFGDDGVIFIEVKRKSRNKSGKSGNTKWKRYVDDHCSFVCGAQARRSRMYELARNWRIGWEYAGDRPFTLVNLAPSSLFKNSDKTLGVFAGSVNQDSKHRFRLVAWPEIMGAIPDKPTWLKRYDSDRDLSSSRLDLVRPIVEEMSLEDCAAVLSETKGFLGEAAIRHLLDISQSQVDTWGTSMKRLNVDIPRERRPYLISGKIQSHNLIEIINQCATMERLVDAMRWMSVRGSEFADCTVVSCHPTTSSVKKATSGLSDHDLILRSPSGEPYFFEVSDVAGTKDGNKKELKDLISLGALGGTVKSPRPANTRPQARLFLICSSTFSKRICDPKRKVGALKSINYRVRSVSEWTSVVEVDQRQNRFESDAEMASGSS